MLLTEEDDFEPEPCPGRRLFCVLVPVSRKLEFAKSSLGQSLKYCSDKLIFYTEIL